MFEHLFENRNRTVTNLLKLSDCLGRSLRENVELFAIDSDKGEAAFLTESGKVIVGNFSIDSNIQLDDIRVQDMDIFSSNEVFDSYVNEKISDFIGSVNSDDYSDAETKFSDVLSLWENRLKFENVKKKLEEKVSIFSESQNIIDTDQFQRFLEVIPQFTNFLQENKEEITKFKEIENAIRLSNSVSKAFNFPRLELDDLDGESYKISKGINESVYELLCKQELVKKELIESKKSFDDIWATNGNIRQLASLMFESSEDEIIASLVEAIVDVPFLALTTKKQLFECLDNALSLSEYNSNSSKDIKEYASRLFEMKKPMKKMVIALLNEKYGINVQNLKETATFNSLASTQVVIFEALSRLAPKGSVVKDTLVEMAKMLKSKNGVEVIDINDVLQECFSECEFTEFLSEHTLIEGVEFESILDDDATAATLLEAAKEKMAKEKKTDSDDQGKEDKEDDDSKEIKKKESAPASEEEEEDDSISKSEKNTKGKKDDEEEDDEKESTNEEASEEPEEEEEDKPLTQDEFLEALKDLDSLEDTLASDDSTETKE